MPNENIRQNIVDSQRWRQIPRRRLSAMTNHADMTGNSNKIQREEDFAHALPELEILAKPRQTMEEVGKAGSLTAANAVTVSWTRP